MALYSGLGYGLDSSYESPYIDLRNVPKTSVTVTVSIADEKLKETITAKLYKLRNMKDRAVNAEQWDIVYRCAVRIKVLEEVIKEAGI